MKIGVDWGGTKIEAVLINSSDGAEINRLRVDSPQDDYEAIIKGVVDLIKKISASYENFTVGIGMPGSLHPETGLVQVSNTKALENKPVKKDLESMLGYEVKIANDADCLALSEAIDGAGKGYSSVFAVILGTGVGAGYVVDENLNLYMHMTWEPDNESVNLFTVGPLLVQDSGMPFYTSGALILPAELNTTLPPVKVVVPSTHPPIDPLAACKLVAFKSPAS